MAANHDDQKPKATKMKTLGILLIIVLCLAGITVGIVLINNGSQATASGSDGEIAITAPFSMPGGPLDKPDPSKITDEIIPESGTGVVARLGASPEPVTGSGKPATQMPLLAATNETVIIERAASGSQTRPEPVTPARTAKPIAADKPAFPTIAVLPFEVKGNSFAEKDTGEMIADMIVAGIDSARFNITERQRLQDLVAEMDFSNMAAAASDAAAAQLGRSAKADYILTGTLGRLGGRYFLSGRLINTSDNSTRVGARAMVDFDSIRQIHEKIPELVNLLSLRDTAGNTSGPQIAGVSDAAELVAAINPDQKFNILLSTADGQYNYAEGEYISFKISCERDCYLTLITVDPTGTQTLLLPNRWRKSTFLRRGRELVIPAEDWGFKFPVLPPHGRTIVKAIATARPIRIEGISEATIVDSGFAVAGKEGLRAIGVAADLNSPAPAESALPVAMETLFKSDQWATSELEVVTYDPNAPEQKSGGEKDTAIIAGITSPADLPQPQVSMPTAFNITSDMTNATASEKLLARYDELTRDLITGYHPLPAPEKIDGITGPKVTSVLVIDGKNMRVVPLEDSGDPDKIIRMLKAASPAATIVPNIKLTSFANPTADQQADSDNGNNDNSVSYLQAVQWAVWNQFNANMDTRVLNCYHKHNQHDTTPAAVAVVDSAIDFDDPRLAQCAALNMAELNTNGRDDDANGYIDDAIGYNFLTQSGSKLCEDSDRFNHGSFVASLIAGKLTGNKMDVIGIAPNTKIIPATCLSSQTGGTTFGDTGELDRVLLAMQYAIDRGAKVINMSLGKRVSPQQLAELEKLPIWNEIEKRDVLVICAAGNDSVDTDTNPVFPACVSHPNIISVMAIDPDGRMGSDITPTGEFRQFTNFGGKSVDIAAPGSFILGVSSRGKAALRSGTSFSTAYVTAAAALVRGTFPDLSAAETKKRILDNAQKLKTLTGKCRSEGMLDMSNLLD